MTTVDSRTASVSKAVDFIYRSFEELGKTEEQAILRCREVAAEIEANGTYSHTFEELEHGARMAWRNNNRCIGRLFWNSLTIFDERMQISAQGVFDALCRHIEFATNGGKIRPAITIFPANRGSSSPVRIWNHQLVRYAGYEEDGKVTGDSSSIEFTKQCQQLGWRGAGTNFDILPLVIQLEGQQPQLFEIPQHLVLEVDLQHPDYPSFSSLGAKWYAVPIISDMKLEIGGIEYEMAPFNGWYMGTEIGARNLADEDRYDLLPAVADAMGLDRSTNRSLWRDRALVELNVAVLESFNAADVTIVDHHTAAKQFKNFERKEESAGREVTGNWAWLIPPMSPATTHIFHKPYKNNVSTPNYFYQKAPYLL